MNYEQSDLNEEFTLDIDKWIKRFPIAPLPLSKLANIGKVGIVALWEQIRKKHLEAGGAVAVPVDTFVLGLGEPSRRDVTKVGGLPYRPGNQPWPERAEYGPMTFLAQFRFAESKDFMGSLPGAILLVFVRDSELDFYGREPDYFHFEWYPLGLPKLIEPKKIPKPAWTFATCYGVRHRSVDFVSFEECASILRPVLLDYFPDLGPYDFDIQIASLIQWRGLKIGGTFELGNVEVEEAPSQRFKFLGCIPTIRPAFSAPYHWINRPEPVASFPYPPDEILQWWLDNAWINLFLDQSGKVVPICATSDG